MTIKLKLNGAWVDITNMVIKGSVTKKKERLYSKLSPNTSIFSFQVINNINLINMINSQVQAIEVQVDISSTPYFRGTLTPNYSSDIRASEGLQHIKLECEDYTQRKLKVKIKSNLVYVNQTVTTIMQDLITRAGLVYNTSNPVISDIIYSLVVLDVDKKTYFDVLKDLVFEFGYTFYLDNAGKFTLFNWAIADTTDVPEEKSSTTLLKEIKIKKTLEEYTEVNVKWQRIALKSGITLFRDTEGADDTYKDGHILIAADAFYPKSATMDEDYYADYNSQEYEIHHVVSATLNYTADGLTLEKSLVNYGKKALFLLRNNTVSDKYINKLEITGNAYVVEEENTTRMPIRDIDDNPYEYTAQYIFDKAKVDFLTQALRNYYLYSDFTYVIRTKSHHNIGDILKINDDTFTSSVIYARIVEKEEYDHTDVIEYMLEGISDYTYTDQPTTSGSFIPPTITVAEKPAVYRLRTNTEVIKAYPDLTYAPQTLVINAEQYGGLTTPIPYAGILKMYINGFIQYESASPESQKVWNGFHLYPEEGLYPEDTLYPQFEFGLSSNDIELVTVELWNSAGTVKLDTRNISFVKDVTFQMDDIINDTYESMPKYLGLFEAVYPTVFKAGDWFVVFDADDDPIQRGLYRVKADLTFERLDGMEPWHAEYYQSALPDILNIANSLVYGQLEDYGQITFIANLASNVVFTQALRVGSSNLDTTLIENGKIKTSLLEAQEIVSNAAYFEGTINADAGIFRGSINSGPMILNISAPSTATVSTGGKLVNTFVEELITGNILPGQYNASGTYNSQAIDAIESYKGQPYTISQETANYTTWSGLSSYSQGGITYWRGTATIHTCYRDKIGTKYRFRTFKAGVEKSTAEGDVWPSSAWYEAGSYSVYYAQLLSKPSNGSPPTGTLAAGNTCPTLATGSISFTASSYTMQLINLPAYSASLPQWTAYLEADGGGNYILKIKG